MSNCGIMPDRGFAGQPYEDQPMTPGTGTVKGEAYRQAPSCARPSCEHPASHHVVIGGCNIDTERGLCPCPAYRTEAQQEAWEALHDAFMEPTDDLRVFHDVAGRLLELYP